jgi:hypothetical protein
MNSTFGTDVLGLDYLPPSPLYPIGSLLPPDAGAPPAAAPPASAVDPSQALGTTPPAPAGPGPGGLNLGPLLRSALAPQTQNAGGLLGSLGLNADQAGRIMSGLGGGLSSAGQNWNKPAMAAFAGGAGAAIQGGQQFQNLQQDAKLKALNAAIAAWKIGDMASYHQALANYRAAVTQQRLASTSPRIASQGGLPAASVNPNNEAPAPAAQPSGQVSTPGQGAGGGPFAPPSIVYGNGPGAGAAAAAPPTAASSDPLAQARDAIARGASRAAAIARLRDNGIDPAGL